MDQFTAKIYEEKSRATGRSSLLLVVTAPGGKRRKESLKLYFQTEPRNLSERKEREEKMLIAAQIVNQREMEFLKGAYDIPEQYRTSEDFLAYAWNYVHQLKGVLVEIKKHEAALRKFEAFIGKKSIPAYEVTPQLLKMFVKHMESHLRGTTPQGYLCRVKIMLKAATEDLLFRKNPADDLSARQIGAVTKAVLNMAEIQQLWETPLDNDQVRRSFLFACTCGLRLCDVNSLQWKNINGDRLEIVQRKTGYALTLPLKQEALELLGNRRGDNDLVFQLPSHTSVGKWLRVWAKEAGIHKKISFHVARHSLATNLIYMNVNLAVASKILGHCNIAQTQRYVRISEEMKENALDQLSFFNQTKSA